MQTRHTHKLQPVLKGDRLDQAIWSLCDGIILS